ncbi:MAG TPA: TIGR03790 family protein [Vicinamibacterales bacterium]|jgi:uncharacterized protein (TIGR03790 family)
MPPIPSPRRPRPLPTPTSIRRHARTGAVAIVLLLLPWLAAAQTADNVLLVVNESSPDSVRVGEYYAGRRHVPQSQVCRIRTDAADEVERGIFETQIETPLAKWLQRNSAVDRILYIVLTKGVPLRIKGTAGRDGTMASVDSELALLYRKLTGTLVPVVGRVANPYYLGDAPVAQARLFSHQSFDIFLVTRLDGYTFEDVKGLIDRAIAPVSTGRVLLDQKAGFGDAGGNQWLRATADWMAARGFGDRTVLETTSRVLTSEKDVLGYYSWGSGDPSITARHLGIEFVPGAIAATFVSTDARTFREPPAEWKIGTWTDRKTFFADSPQSLAGDLIRDGVTGIAGHVAEPYLDATIRPNVLFPAYFSGFNLAESFYLAMPYLGWQTVVVGDPLCTPFPRQALQPTDIDKGIDATTELPALFSARRLQTIAASAVKPDAARSFLRAEVRLAKDDKPGARMALEQATVLDPRLVTAQVLLGTLYDEGGEYDKAIETYRKVVAGRPNEAISLNNLAFALAVRKKQPADALAYAERAYALAPGNLNVVDTLAWVQHLCGRDEDAGRLLSQLLPKAADHAEVQFHAAVVFGALGMLDRSAAALAEAVRLDAALEGREEVKALRAKLK